MGILLRLMSEMGLFLPMRSFLSGTGRGTGGGLMLRYQKSAPAGTPSCAGVGGRGVTNYRVSVVPFAKARGAQGVGG